MYNLSDGVEMRGIEKGRKQNIQEVLKNALQMNMPMQDISRLTNTPMAELEALTAQLNVA